MNSVWNIFQGFIFCIFVIPLILIVPAHAQEDHGDNPFFFNPDSDSISIQLTASADPVEFGTTDDFQDSVLKRSKVAKKTALIRIPRSSFKILDVRDPDKDNLPTVYEEFIGTNPRTRDTDKDGFGDDKELNTGFSPLSRSKTRIQPLAHRERFTGSIWRVKGSKGVLYRNPFSRLFMLFPSRDAFQTYALQHAETLFTFSSEVKISQPNPVAQPPETRQQSIDTQPSQSQPPPPAAKSDQQLAQQQEAPQEKQPTQNQNATTPAPQPTPITISVTVPSHSTADLVPGMSGALIAKFQLQSQASERVELRELVFDDAVVTRGKVSPFKKVVVSINNRHIPLVRQGSVLTTSFLEKPIATLAGTSSITVDVVADIEPVIPARLHDLLLGSDENLTLERVDARGEITQRSASVTPDRSELTPFRFVRIVDEAKISCNASAESFKQTGKIQCGRIAWELTPQVASEFVGDPRPFFMKYDALYQFYKDFMGGHEPPQGKIAIRENPSNPYPADANWQDSVIRTNTGFAKDQFVYLANHDLQPYAPSFMHELGHIFGLTSPSKHAFIWKDFVEGNANLIGILPYLMAYDGFFTMGVDFWCTNKLKVAWPCDGTFSDFEMYPEWLGANKDLVEYERENETLSTLFIRPPADQNVYERGGKFMTMITTLYTEWKKAGKGRRFWDAYRKTQQFYTTWKTLLPTEWKNDADTDMPSDTILKMNTYLLLISSYAGENILAIFESRWRFPILQKTKDAYAKIIAAGSTDAVVREQLELYLAPSMSIPTPVDKGLTGSYYNSADLSGAPVLVRKDSEIDFVWKASSPATGVRENQFSVRWEGVLTIPTTGSYTFTTLTDDGIRLWVNNQQLINDWTEHAPKINSGLVSLIGGTRVPIKVEYYDGWWDASIRLGWSGPGIPDQIIPATSLSPSTQTQNSFFTLLF